jgi:hypothetical protein
MKGAISLLLLILLGFLPSFNVQSEPDDWVEPTEETVTKICSSRNADISTCLDTPIQYCEQYASQATASSDLTYTANGASLSQYNQVICDLKTERKDGLCCGNPSFEHYGWTQYDKGIAKSCTDPNYQNSEDLDMDGQPDHCHATNCPDSDFLFSTSNYQPTASGSICIQHPSPDGIAPGKMCSYESMQNSDGTRSNYNFSPSGQGCNCEDEATPCVDRNDGFITEDAIPEGCQAVGEMVFCDANQEDHCDTEGCDNGCGLIGDRFMCQEYDLDEGESNPCTANDQRYSCNGQEEGSCPVGITNCADTTQEPDTSDPNNPNEGIENKLDKTNRKLTDIEKNTKGILDALTADLDIPDINPDNNADWQNTKNQMNNIIESDTNADHTSFENSVANNQSDFTNSITGLIPSTGTCSAISIVFPKGTLDINACDTFTKIRYILEWIIALLTIIYVKHLFERELKPKGA